jgi:hypothetical protein
MTRQLPKPLIGATYLDSEATWRSGYATVCKSDCGYRRLSPRIPESHDLSALLECSSVPHPFPSPIVPQRSVAISVAMDLNCSRVGQTVSHSIGGLMSIQVE